MYVCTYVCMYACRYILCMCCMYVYMYVRTYVCMYVCMCVCLNVRTFACMYICMYACMYVCMYFCTHDVEQRQSSHRSLNICANIAQSDMYVWKKTIYSDDIDSKGNYLASVQTTTSNTLNIRLNKLSKTIKRQSLLKQQPYIQTQMIIICKSLWRGCVLMRILSRADANVCCVIWRPMHRRRNLPTKSQKAWCAYGKVVRSNPTGSRMPYFRERKQTGRPMLGQGCTCNWSTPHIMHQAMPIPM